MEDTKLFLNSIIEEMDAIEELLGSAGWRVLRGMLADHKAYLQNQANLELRKHQDRKAGEYLAAMGECDVIINRVRERLTVLRDLAKNKED